MTAQDAFRTPESLTLRRALTERASATPDASFLRFEDAPVLSFAQMHERSLAAAWWLHHHGVRRGQVVAVALPNGTDALVWWFALNMLGAVDAAINPSLRGAPLAHALRLVGAQAILLTPDFVPLVTEIAAELPDLRKLWVVGSDPARMLDTPHPFAVEHASPLFSDGAAGLPDGAGESLAQDVATLIYTSGTTGPAKAVRMTHAQVFVVAELTRRGLWLGPEDTTLCAHPLFHMAARDCGVLPCLLTGGTLALERRFQAETWVDRAIATGATATLMHGPLLEMIYAQPERAEDGQMRLSRLGTSPFPAHIAAAFEKRFRVKGIETWGMTEIGIPAWVPPEAALRAGSCGKIQSEYYDFKICDPDTGAALPVGEVGEFNVRAKSSPILMAGYYGQPALAADAWFPTGDFGHIDAEGWLWFAARASERIRRRAENISPYEIERAAMAMGAFQECAAVGVASEFANDDEILLCLLPKPAPEPLNAQPPSDEAAVQIIADLARRLPHHMVPRYLMLVSQFERTPTGKIRKDSLRKGFDPQKCWDRKASGVALRALYAPAAPAGPA